MASPILGGSAVLECVESRASARRVRLRFRVSLVAGWRPSGGTLLIHAAAPLRPGVRLAMRMSAGGAWVDAEGRHEGGDWLRVPAPAAVAAALVAEPKQALELQWKEPALRLDGRETVRYAPYFIVERP
ncbi:MAG: hypothetical protein R2762_29065 [Bryobacteraceae bacterium]